MRFTAARAGVLLLALSAAPLSGCCHCKEYVPLPCAEYRECRHPKLAEVDECLRPCASAPAEARTVCTRSCCGLVDDIAGATEAEKATLRACRAGCR